MHNDCNTGDNFFRTLSFSFLFSDQFAFPNLVMKKEKESHHPSSNGLLRCKNVSYDYWSRWDIREEQTIRRKRMERGELEEDGEFSDAAAF